jgi:hypothetical protein
MKRGRVTTFIVSLTIALTLLTALSGIATASPASGVKGDPQPEAQPFRLSNTDSSLGTIAFEPTGSMVAAWDVPAGTTGATVVCTLNRGGRSCGHKVTLHTINKLGLDTDAGPHVLVTSANHVSVLEDGCCDDVAAGDTLLYSSTNGGKSFGAPVRVGSVATGAAVLVGSNLVFIGSDFPDGIQVESIPVGAAGPSATVAGLSGDRGDVGLSTYHGGVLAGWDFDGTTENTYVDYASSGSDLNSSSSYHKVITIKNESLVGLSGNALVTAKQTGTGSLVLRLFNGKTFGPPHTVPTTKSSGPEWYGMQQDPSGATHVFFEPSDKGYHLIILSTRTGSRWSSYDAGNATDSYSFAAGLDSHGSGIVLGPGGNQVTAFPVLEAQHASFTLKSSSIRQGRSTTGSGTGSPASVGRLVSLQVERSGRWHTVATTHEKSGGKFSFTIKGTSAGTFSYRAVISDLAGYLEFGYSSARSLRVTS